MGFELLERGIPRHGYSLCSPDDETIGEVSSGSFSPTLRKGIGLGYVPVGNADTDAVLKVDIRGRKLEARVVKTPFYRRSEPS